MGGDAGEEVLGTIPRHQRSQGSSGRAGSRVNVSINGTSRGSWVNVSINAASRGLGNPGLSQPSSPALLKTLITQRANTGTETLGKERQRRAHPSFHLHEKGESTGTKGLRAPLLELN